MNCVSDTRKTDPSAPPPASCCPSSTIHHLLLPLTGAEADEDFLGFGEDAVLESIGRQLSIWLCASSAASLVNIRLAPDGGP
jgi:hypothetical protein